MLAVWSVVPLPFLKPVWTSGIWQFLYCWSLAWSTLSITSMWDEFNCAVVWTFFGIGTKIDLFQSCGYCWVFQTCWHIECITFTASSFRIWNSSTGIPSPPLALFVVMLSKAHLTSHSRMSGSRWVITPSWLSHSWGQGWQPRGATPQPWEEQPHGQGAAAAWTQEDWEELLHIQGQKGWPWQDTPRPR